MNTEEGNHLQIPNSAVYKSSILNYTSNPNQRISFIIGMGYDTSVTSAQDLALKSNDEEILEQARKSRSPEEGEDLLKPKE